MAHEHQHTAKREASSLSLPPQVISQADVGRLLQEITEIDESLLQLKLRSGGKPTKLAKTSRLMDLTSEYNKLNLLRETDRHLLTQYLQAVQQQAPRLHFSFASDAPPAFLEKLITWLRREINPHVVITVGLQPNIGAGCIMRSHNRQFDFSLSQAFSQKRDLLLKQLTQA